MANVAEMLLVDQGASFDIERDVVESIACGQRSATVFQEGEADKVVSRECQGGLA